MTRRRRGTRGMTLLEVMVSIAILAMIAILLYGAFDSLSRGKKGEGIRTDRARQGRQAIARISRDVQSTFLSLHMPPNVALQTRVTAFIGTHQTPFDRLDFAAFAHQRFERDAKESDQAEVGYFVVPDPERDGKMDLVRREQTPPDLDPKRGGTVNVVAEDVETFTIKYLDPLSGLWQENWDSTQALMQQNRLPLAIRINLILKGVPNGTPSTFTTKIMLPMQQPLSFGISR
jgi:general secretion pathway protein J